MSHNYNLRDHTRAPPLMHTANANNSSLLLMSQREKLLDELLQGLLNNIWMHSYGKRSPECLYVALCENKCEEQWKCTPKT